jgi:FkbM family methyltransferase
MSSSRLYRRFQHAELALRHFLVLAKRIGVWKAVQLTFSNKFGTGYLTVRYPGLRSPFMIRARSSDFDVFREILLYSEMGFPVAEPPQRVLDAGANIGLSTLAFVQRFPEAEVIAIEPEAGNFELLTRNLASYPNVTCVHGALWTRPGVVFIDNEDAANWSFTVSDRQPSVLDPTHSIRAYTVNELMQLQDWDSIDLLKMDIEGAEKDIFDGDGSWLDKVKILVVETHDRLRPGTRRSVYRATDGFPWEYEAGEKLVFSKAPLTSTAMKQEN